jgi:hypothetical protein
MLDVCPCRAVPAPGQVRYEAHMLDAAASPLVAALPQYERGFRDHLAAGRAYAEATQVRACLGAVDDPLGLPALFAFLPCSRRQAA